jgi:hypothetical protein
MGSDTVAACTSAPTADDALEEAVPERGIEVLRRLTGRAPHGYRSPAWERKPCTPALLARLGFDYDSSLLARDVPHMVETPGRGLVELPITWISGDSMQVCRASGIGSPAAAFDVFAQEFEPVPTGRALGDDHAPIHHRPAVAPSPA